MATVSAEDVLAALGLEQAPPIPPIAPPAPAQTSFETATHAATKPNAPSDAKGSSEATVSAEVVLAALGLEQAPPIPPIPPPIINSPERTSLPKAEATQTAVSEVAASETAELEIAEPVSAEVPASTASIGAALTETDASAAEIAAATDLNVPAPDVARATVEPVVILYVPGIPAPPPAISSPKRVEIAQTEELGTLVVDPPKNRANSWETTVRDKLPAATLPPVSFTATAEQTIKSSPISLPSGAEAASAEGLQSQSTAAFANIPSGTPFSEAREILLSNGWRPREISAFERPELIRYMESAHIEAGHSEVVNCNDAVRALCRFEYVDGSERITTLLSVGKTVEEALIVDVFEMQIRSPIQ